jgi:phosphate starvation-inducible protein PhoH and related proteins
MARQPKKAAPQPSAQSNPHGRRQPFHLEFKNQAQKMAWGAFDQHDVLFLLGPAGCGKTHLACAFAISEILAKRKKKCILTRPIVEAGESLGFLPGTFDEKVNPYMMPMYDCIEKCVGREGPQREILDRSIEVAPIAYMRGRTFDNAVCIFDEAQNATISQLKLFMTRFGENSKIIITGDPLQSDLRRCDQGLMHVVNRLEDLPGIGIIHFKANSIVRHPLIASILEKLEDREEVVE